MGIPIKGGFGDVEAADTDFEPLPTGTYSATVYEAEVREAGADAKNPGSQYIAVTYAITDDDYEGRRAWANYSLVEKARPFLKAFLKAVGFTDAELDDPDFELDLDDFVGRPVTLKINQKKNPNSGETQHNVKSVQPASASADADDLP